jgi:hypothetical protein
VDREGLNAQEQKIHEEAEGEHGDDEAGQRLPQVGRRDEGQPEEEGERQVEGQAVRGHRQAGEGRPRAARDVLAATRLAVPAGLVRRRDRSRLAVVLRQEPGRDRRSGEAQAEGHDDPRPRAHSQGDLPKDRI